MAFADVRGMICNAPRAIFLNEAGQYNHSPRTFLKNLFFACAILLTGCASTTGVISAGKDQYMIAREDNGPAASLGAIKAQVFQEAGMFCGSKGKAMEIVRENDVPRSFGQFPQTSLQFKCV